MFSLGPLSTLLLSPLICHAMEVCSRLNRPPYCQSFYIRILIYPGVVEVIAVAVVAIATVHSVCQGLSL